MTVDLIRQVTGYLAVAGIALYWLFLLTGRAPQIRRGTRSRSLAAKVLLVETTAAVATVLVVVEIHFMATELWQVLAVVAFIIPTNWLLRRIYRRLVAAPRHSLWFLIQRPERLPRRSGHRLGR